MGASGGGSEIPAWAEFEFNPRHWIDLMRSMGVDEDSQQSLFALAQFNSDGKEAANSIVGQLIKHKINQGPFKTNVSAFVHGCSIKGRSKIEAQSSSSYFRY